ncbi:unnamed protein product [Amoebophrya sp. A120]|nr:unnamed protein product [Amoebophrya sp. A120]|eukprot:GSA120T00018378001.1
MGTITGGSNKSAELVVFFDLASSDKCNIPRSSVSVEILVDGRRLPRSSGGASMSRMEVPHDKLWSPARPELVDLRIEVTSKGTVLDIFHEKIGLRTLGSNAAQRITLNGNPTMLKGINRHDNFFLSHDTNALYEGLLYFRDVLLLLDPESAATRHLVHGSGSGGPGMVGSRTGEGGTAAEAADVPSGNDGDGEDPAVEAQFRQKADAVWKNDLQETLAKNTAVQSSREISLLSKEAKLAFASRGFVDVTLHVSRTAALHFLEFANKVGVLQKALDCISVAAATQLQMLKSSAVDDVTGAAATSEHSPFATPTHLFGHKGRCSSKEKDHAFFRQFLIDLREVLLVKDLNANFVRGAHYSQGEVFLTLCDIFGLLVWEETMSWQASQGDAAHPAFVRAQLEAMAGTVAAHRLHASVAVWGFLNEVDGREHSTRSQWSDEEKHRITVNALEDDEGEETAGEQAFFTSSTHQQLPGDVSHKSWFPRARDLLLMRSILPRDSFSVTTASTDEMLTPSRAATSAAAKGDKGKSLSSHASAPPKSSPTTTSSSSVSKILQPSPRGSNAVKYLMALLLQVCAHYDPSFSITEKNKSSRFRSFASRYKTSESQDVFDLVDLVVFNDYPGWYDLSTDLAETVTSFRHLSLSGHQVQARGAKPVLIGETGGGGFVGYLTGDKALTWSEERQALIVGLAVLAILFTEEAFAGLCLWQFADQFVNTMNVGYENVAAKIFGLVTAIESPNWEREDRPFPFRPNGLNNKGLLSHDRRYPKLAFDVVKSLYHPLTTNDVAFDFLQQIGLRVQQAKHGKAFLLKNVHHQGYLAVHWWNDMDAHHSKAHADVPHAYKIHTHKQRNRAGVWEAIGIRAAKDHLAVSLRLIGHEDQRADLLQGVEDSKNSFVFVAADDVEVDLGPEEGGSGSLEVLAVFNEGGVAAHFQVGLEQELFSETGFPAKIEPIAFSNLPEKERTAVIGDACICLAEQRCKLLMERPETTGGGLAAGGEAAKNNSAGNNDVETGAGVVTTSEAKQEPTQHAPYAFDVWGSSFFALEGKAPRASQIESGGRLGFFLVGSEAGRESQGNLHLAPKNPGFERDEESHYMGLQSEPRTPEEFWWEMEFV